MLDRLRRKRRRIDDPLFGTLTAEPPWWRGMVRVPPITGEVAINVESGEAGPTDAQRERFRELEHRYQTLLQDIGTALWELYRPVRLELARDAKARLGPSSPGGMVQDTTLFGVDIRTDGKIELSYSFWPDVGWDDAMFTVGIAEWTARPLGLDD
jgi:hypothetical protein